MKSERMKTSGMGWGAGGKESEIVLGFREEGFGDHDGKFSIIWLLLSFSRGKQQRKEERENPNEERRDCDFVNISAKSLDLRLSKLNGIRCCAFNLRQEKNSSSQVIFSQEILMCMLHDPSGRVLHGPGGLDLLYTCRELFGNIRPSG